MENADEKRGKALDSSEKIEQPKGNEKDEAKTEEELRKQFEDLHLSPQRLPLSQAKNTSSFYSALDAATTAVTGSEAKTKSQAEKVLSSRKKEEEKKEHPKGNSR